MYSLLEIINAKDKNKARREIGNVDWVYDIIGN